MTHKHVTYSRYSTSGKLLFYLHLLKWCISLFLLTEDLTILQVTSLKTSIWMKGRIRNNVASPNILDFIHPLLCGFTIHWVEGTCIVGIWNPEDLER